jgi:hypothetical protein
MSQTADQRRALRLLTNDPHGVTEALMQAHGFRREIQARLGGDRSGFEFGDKSRGMHWRTYERWRERFWGSRFARRLGAKAFAL